MTYARKSLVSLADTPYYHVVARCVRRAWFWGVDEYAGRDRSHRKTWVLERLSEFSSIFTIEVCAYAVLSAIKGHSPGHTPILAIKKNTLWDTHQFSPGRLSTWVIGTHPSETLELSAKSVRVPD